MASNKGWVDDVDELFRDLEDSGPDGRHRPGYNGPEGPNGSQRDESPPRNGGRNGWFGSYEKGNPYSGENDRRLNDPGTRWDWDRGPPRPPPLMFTGEGNPYICPGFNLCMSEFWDQNCAEWCSDTHRSYLEHYNKCMVEARVFEPLLVKCEQRLSWMVNCTRWQKSDKEDIAILYKCSSQYDDCFNRHIRQEDHTDIYRQNGRKIDSKSKLFDNHDNCTGAAYEHAFKNRASPIVAKSASSTNSAVPIGVSCSVIVVLLVLLFVLCVLFKRRKPKIIPFGLPIGEMGVGKKESTNFYHQSPSVTPTAKDIWELNPNHISLSTLLGHGNFGRVYKARINSDHLDISSHFPNFIGQTENEYFAAVKQCHEYADELTKREFLREIELMKNIGHHAKLVNILFCITSVEPFCLIVEYCAFGDLLKYLVEAKSKIKEMAGQSVTVPEQDGSKMFDIFDLKTLISFMFQISDGMQFLCQKGYVHCDLAARNIMVFDERNLKIGDFGLCRFLSNDCIYMSKGGRLPIKWMALEAIENFEFTTHTDMWSFGIVMFEIITHGGHPYSDVMPSDGDFRGAMMEYLKSGKRMPQPSECPDNIFALMQATWNEVPEHRPTFDDIRESLRKILEEIGTKNYYGDCYVDAGGGNYQECLIRETSDSEPVEC